MATTARQRAPLPSPEERAAVVVEELRGAFASGWLVVTAPGDLETMRAVVEHHVGPLCAHGCDQFAYHYRAADPVGGVWWFSVYVIRRLAGDLPALAEALAATTERPYPLAFPSVYTDLDAS